MSRASAFDEALREIAVPILAARGFVFDGRRTFRRLAGDQRTCAIINLQLGQRSLAGKFTVNLGVFAEGDSPGVAAGRAHEHHCRFERRARIGTLVPPRFPRLAALGFVGFLFGSRDRWWPFSEDRARTHAAVSAAIDEVLAHGIGWLDAPQQVR